MPSKFLTENASEDMSRHTEIDKLSSAQRAMRQSLRTGGIVPAGTQHSICPAFKGTWG